jgi:hypothetical protein
MRPAVLATAGHATGQAAPPNQGAENPAPDRSSADHALALEAVLLEFEKTLPLRAARLYVEIADSLVHLDVVSGEFSGDSDRQLQSIADACVGELLGDAAPRHLIRWQLQAGGQHLLIGAIPRDLLATVSEAAVRHGLSLCSVQPDFCLQWNRHAQALKPGNAVFAVASGQDAVVALVLEGAVATLSCGSWLDAPDSSAVQNAHVTQLMCGLGLMPSSTAGVLDSRVDRLLASAGLAAEDQSAYVLVAPQVPDGAVSSRWTVVSRPAPSA